MTNEYPETGGLLVYLDNIKGVSQDQLLELQNQAQAVAVENIGIPSIFTVTSFLQEWLQDNNLPGQDESMYSGKQ